MNLTSARNAFNNSIQFVNFEEVWRKDKAFFPQKRSLNNITEVLKSVSETPLLTIEENIIV